MPGASEQVTGRLRDGQQARAGGASSCSSRHSASGGPTSELGQYGFDPKEFVVVARSLPGLTPVGNARIERPLADVIAAVAASRDELVHQAPSRAGH